MADNDKGVNPSENSESGSDVLKDVRERVEKIEKSIIRESQIERRDNSQQLPGSEFDTDAYQPTKSELDDDNPPTE